MGAELGCCWRRGGRWMIRHGVWLAGGTLLVLLVAWWWATQGVDSGGSVWLRLADDHPGSLWSERIGFWGDFAQYNLVIVAVLWVVGLVRRHSKWRRAAAAAFLAAVLAGVVCNEFRFATGRPRPVADRVDVATGPSLEPRNQSFPSGHTAVAFATSTPVLVLVPGVGLVLTGISAAVAWARMADGMHYPSDVLVGGWLGICFGLACGLGMRRRARRVGNAGSGGIPAKLPARRQVVLAPVDPRRAKVPRGRLVKPSSRPGGKPKGEVKAEQPRS